MFEACRRRVRRRPRRRLPACRVRRPPRTPWHSPSRPVDVGSWPGSRHPPARVDPSRGRRSLRAPRSGGATQLPTSALREFLVVSRLCPRGMVVRDPHRNCRSHCARAHDVAYFRRLTGVRTRPPAVLILLSPTKARASLRRCTWRVFVSPRRAFHLVTHAYQQFPRARIRI